MNKYPALTDTNHVYKEIEVDTLIKKLNKKESFVVILGFPECPWCQAIMPVLNDVAKESNEKTVYYLYLKEIRDDENHKNHDKYLELVNNHFKDAIDTKNNRLNAPTVIKVEKGIMTKYHIDTVSSHVMNENHVLPALTEEQKDELKNILREFFN